MSLEDSLLAGRDAERFFFSSTWVRETDGACQTVVCGFIQIYDGRKQGWMWTGRESGCKGGDGRHKGQLSVQDSERLEVSGSLWIGGGEEVPTQWWCCSNWLCFILAHCSVCCCFVVCRGERPCLHIELHYIPPRTPSCLSDCLIGICLGFATTKASCLISH